MLALTPQRRAEVESEASVTWVEFAGTYSTRFMLVKWTFFGPATLHSSQSCVSLRRRAVFRNNNRRTCSSIPVKRLSFRFFCFVSAENESTFFALRLDRKTGDGSVDWAKKSNCFSLSEMKVSRRRWRWDCPASKHKSRNLPTCLSNRITTYIEWRWPRRGEAHHCRLRRRSDEQ